MKPKLAVPRHWAYFEIDKARQDYKGVRFFKVDAFSDTIIQVVLHAGEMKRGRGHHLGIMVISKINWYANYLAMGYAIPSTKKRFEMVFKEVIKLLS